MSKRSNTRASSERPAKILGVAEEEDQTVRIVRGDQVRQRLGRRVGVPNIPNESELVLAVGFSAVASTASGV
jgi:hypothetical protein